MSKNLSMISLGEVLTQSEARAEIEPQEQYRQVTVRLWGKGVELRTQVAGTDIAASKQFIVRTNQFIVSKIDARNGAFGLIPDSLDGAVVSSDFPVFTPNRSRLLPEFLDWMSKTHDFVELCQAASEGTTNRVRLKVGRFLATKIPLPPLEEQQRIVVRIEEFATKIEEARGLYTSINSDIYGTLLSAYNTIIKDAKLLPMRDVAPLERRPIEVKPEEEYFELGIRSFGKGTFHKPSITGASLGTKRIFSIEEGDLLFNIVFAWEGAVAVAQPEDRGRVGSHRFLTCVPKKALATSFYLCFHFLTSKGLQQLLDASPGSAGRNRTLGIKALEEIQVPVPPIEKQQWFDSLQERFHRVRHLHSGASVELDALLPSILDRAFKGEL